MMSRKIILTAICLLAVAVALGAFGAHTLQKLVPEKTEVFKTGVTYQFYHGLALLLLGILMDVYKKPGLKTAAYLFITGILFFSGSLYFLSIKTLLGLAPDDLKFIGIITPIGGTLFIAGWIVAFFQFLKKSPEHSS